ncbi:multidrug resistance protein 4 [Roridomyces roridus]|uniref:Multidrug resistance protein 4 n=1 Tax=Roridomyces roridus TaxID=1738132 RepID=A0AAD7CKR0_9AGAR|nr:multidrug resistance protein 4 [Roridomyces roridus]
MSTPTQAQSDEKAQSSAVNLEHDWEHDLENPRNWALGKKWTSAAIVSLYTFIPPLSSSILAPGLPELAEKYKITNSTILAFTLSIFLLSYGVAPLILAPLSEMYGRRWVLNLGNFITIGFTVGCAFAPNTGALLAFRFLSGLSGSASVACGGGVVGDLFSERDRALAMALYTLGPLIGPVVGPIMGGFVTETIGVKWVFIIVAGMGGISSALGIPLLRETYAPILRLRKARKSADPEKAAVSLSLDKDHSSKLHYLWLTLSRPAMLLFGSPVCFMLSLYMAFMYGIYYLMFTTFDVLFTNTYGFSTGISGLTYIGLGGGFILATLVAARWGNQVYLYLAKKNGGKAEPEMRIPGVVLGSIFVPIGLFWYGWSAQARIHWIMPVIGSGIFGFGMTTTFLPMQLYLVDTFAFAASALSAASVFRSLLGCAFPLFGGAMFDALGYGGGNSLLGGLAIVLGIPFPVYLYYRGAAIRAKSKLTR